MMPSLLCTDTPVSSFCFRERIVYINQELLFYFFSSSFTYASKKGIVDNWFLFDVFVYEITPITFVTCGIMQSVLTMFSRCLIVFNVKGQLKV